jgi:hypothetical protein
MEFWGIAGNPANAPSLQPQRSGHMVFLALTFAIAVVSLELFFMIVHMVEAVGNLMTRTAHHGKPEHRRMQRRIRFFAPPANANVRPK